MLNFLITPTGLIISFYIRGIINSVKATNGVEAFYRDNGSFHFMTYNQPFSMTSKHEMGVSNFEHCFKTNTCKHTKLYLDEFDINRVIFHKYIDMSKLYPSMFDWY